MHDARVHVFASLADKCRALCWTLLWFGEGTRGGGGAYDTHGRQPQYNGTDSVRGTPHGRRGMLPRKVLLPAINSRCSTNS